MKKRKVIYVLSTHWDREWYQTFQDFRYRLVGLFDHILEGFTTGKIRGLLPDRWVRSLYWKIISKSDLSDMTK